MTYEIPEGCKFIEFYTKPTLETPALRMRIPILQNLPPSAHEGGLAALDDGSGYVWANSGWLEIIAAPTLQAAQTP